MPLIPNAPGRGALVGHTRKVLTKEEIANQERYIKQVKAQEEKRGEWTTENQKLIDGELPVAGDILAAHHIYKIFLCGNDRRKGEFQAYVRIAIEGKFPEPLKWHANIDRKGIFLWLNKESRDFIKAEEPTEVEGAIEGMETFVEAALPIRILEIKSPEDKKSSGMAELLEPPIQDDTAGM